MALAYIIGPESLKFLLTSPVALFLDAESGMNLRPPKERPIEDWVPGFPVAVAREGLVLTVQGLNENIALSVNY